MNGRIIIARKPARALAVAAIGLVFTWTYTTSAVEIDSAMYLDPPLEDVQQATVFPPQLKALWLEALSSGEQDLAERSADAFAEAHRMGMQDLEDIVDPLVDLLGSQDSSPAVKLAAARTLIQLDARSAAPELAGCAATGGLDMALLVEPALARWDYGPMRTVWLERLNDSSASRRRLILAFQSLAQVQEPRAAASLLRLALDPSQEASIRLESACCASLVGEAGLDAAARILAAVPPAPLTDRLVAARLIAANTTSPAVELVKRLIDDSEPAIVAIGLEAIAKIDPSLIAERREDLIASRDAKIRRLTAELLVAQQTPQAVEQLAVLLADAHPGLRDYACDSLVQLARDKELRAAAGKAIAQSLRSETPEAVRQGALACGALQERRAVKLLVELLDHTHADVQVAAAWALRKIADPAAAPAILAKIERETECRLALVDEWRPLVAADPYGQHNYPSLVDSNAQIEQLIMALAPMKSDSAAMLFLNFVAKPPRPQVGEPPNFHIDRQLQLRAASVWALGVHYGDQAPEALRAELRSRLGDESEEAPEHPLVRRMASISLGRMKDRQSLDLLRQLAEPPEDHTEFGRSCRWAIQQITEETLPALAPVFKTRSDWFLTPLPR